MPARASPGLVVLPTRKTRPYRGMRFIFKARDPCLPERPSVPTKSSMGTIAMSITRLVNQDQIGRRWRIILEIDGRRLDADATGRANKSSLPSAFDDQVDKIDIVPAGKILDQEWHLPMVELTTVGR